MPRQARVDIPGQVYHVMSRGIERGAIFLDDEDYADFLARVSKWLKETGCICLAWCLMPNHFHFLILRGSRPLAEVMHRVMTGYAVHYNSKHGRCGHLFQNRYKAILCDREEYFLELVPYIHLNPLRAKLVANMAELAGYKWCGHGAVLSGEQSGMLNRSALLSHYGSDELTAIAKYQESLIEQAAAIENTELSGAGYLKALRKDINTFPGKQVLLDQDFLKSIEDPAAYDGEEKKSSLAGILGEVESATGLNRGDIFRHTRERGPAHARALYCHLAREKTGSSIVELSVELGITQSAVSKLALKGRSLAGRLQIVQ